MGAPAGGTGGVGVDRCRSGDELWLQLIVGNAISKNECARQPVQLFRALADLGIGLRNLTFFGEKTFFFKKLACLLR